MPTASCVTHGTVPIEGVVEHDRAYPRSRCCSPRNAMGSAEGVRDDGASARSTRSWTLSRPSAPRAISTWGRPAARRRAHGASLRSEAAETSRSSDIEGEQGAAGIPVGEVKPETRARSVKGLKANIADGGLPAELGRRDLLRSAIFAIAGPRGSRPTASTAKAATIAWKAKRNCVALAATEKVGASASSRFAIGVGDRALAWPWRGPYVTDDSTSKGTRAIGEVDCATSTGRLIPAISTPLATPSGSWPPGSSRSSPA